MHFASELFDTHSRFIQLKSMLIDFFNGEEIESIWLSGLEHVISVSCAAALNNATSTVNVYHNQHPSIEDTSILKFTLGLTPPSY